MTSDLHKACVYVCLFAEHPPFSTVETMDFLVSASNLASFPCPEKRSCVSYTQSLLCLWHIQTLPLNGILSTGI